MPTFITQESIRSPEPVKPERTRSPWWAWLLPACFFLLTLVILWPRPYFIPFKGDPLKYYAGAHFIAEEGRYYQDYYQHPAAPITSNAPLFSILWGGLMYVGVPPVAALAGIHAFFLFVLGAAGGALSYHVTRSWFGPLLWTVLSCCWPGGSQWLAWVRPLTESATTAMFVIVVWMLSCALRDNRPRDTMWLFLASAVAGLSMIMKVTGVFSFPVVGIVSLVLLCRRVDRSRLWLPIAATVLMILPYTIWGIRNYLLIGQIESNKPSHSVDLLWNMMGTTSAGIAQWFLPVELAKPLSQAVHPLLLVGPLVLLPIVVSWLAWRRRSSEALVAGAVVALGFLALGITMTCRLTEEPRYWAPLIPCLVVAVLVLRPPQQRVLGIMFRLVVALFLMFCCARFAITNRSLWYGSQFGFHARQVFMTVSLVAGIYYLHIKIRSLWKSGTSLYAHLIAAAFCGALAVVWWRYTNEPRPMWNLVPLALIGLIMSMPFGSSRPAVASKWSFVALAFLATFWLGRWTVDDLKRPELVVYERNGMLVRATQAVIDARAWLKQNSQFDLYSSNVHEHFSDLFGDNNPVPPPLCASYMRFRAGLSQLPEEELPALQAWLDRLSDEGIDRPFVVIYLPGAEHRLCFYGPESLESLPALNVDWKIHDDDLHIAVCQVVEQQ